MKLQLYPFQFHTCTKPSVHIFFPRNPIKIFLLLALSLASSHSEAQWSDTLYDFSSFVLPDIHYRSLQFSADIDGSTNKFEENEILPESTLSDFDAGGNLSYFRYLNTADKQYSSQFYFSMFEEWRRFSDDEVSRNFRFESRLLGIQHFRRYRGKKFSEFSLLHSTRITPFSSRDDESKLNELSVGVHLRPFFLLGKGRIEPINDVTIAYFLLRELVENGLLTSKISNEDLNQLGHQMARSRNRRVFDVREKRKFELASIDSLIQEKNWLQGYSIEYFTILADNWLYDLRSTRNQGNRLSYGLAPHIYYQHDRRKSEGGPIAIDSESDSKLINLYALVRYESEKPVTVRKQRFYGGSVVVGYDIYDLEGSQFLDDSEFPVGNIMAYYGLGFYPNSRTAWTNRLEGNFSSQYRNEQMGHWLQIGLHSTMVYYLSPRAQIFGNANIFWATTDNYLGNVISGVSGYPLIVYTAPSVINSLLLSPIHGRIGANLNVNFVYQIF